MHDTDDATALLLTCADSFKGLREMAQSFALVELEKIAILGEEIASKSSFAHSQFRMKNCLDAMWDALTTVKFIVSNGVTNSKEELEILTRRLEKQIRYVASLDCKEPVPEMAIECPKDWIFESND